MSNLWPDKNTHLWSKQSDLDSVPLFYIEPQICRYREQMALIKQKHC